MDYEKAYKDAIEKARHFMSEHQTRAEADLMVALFPELAESEDERIRKELIEQVGYILPDKEEYDDEGLVLPAYHKRIERYRAWLEKQKEQKFEPFSWGHENGGLSEKPNNQWSEEDNNALDFIHELISFGYTENFFDAQTAADMRKWIDSRIHHWRPSEEQMEALKHYVDTTTDGEIELLYNDLKKL